MLAMPPVLAGRRCIFEYQFSLCGSTLDVGRSCLIIVILFADDLGSLSATPNISSDAVTGTQSVPLSARVN